MSETELVEIDAYTAAGCVNRAIAKAGNARRFAAICGITEQALCNQRSRIDRSYTETVLRAAGVRVERKLLIPANLLPDSLKPKVAIEPPSKP